MLCLVSASVNRPAQNREGLTGGLAPVAYPVLLLRGKLSHCFAQAEQKEDGVIAETGGTPGPVGYLPRHLPPKDPQRLARLGQGDDADETGAPFLPGYTLQVSQEPVYPFPVRGPEAGRKHPRRPAQGIHEKARVLGQGEETALLGIELCFGHGILLQAGGPLGLVRFQAQLLWGDELKARPGQEEAVFSQLAPVAGAHQQAQTLTPCFSEGDSVPLRTVALRP